MNPLRHDESQQRTSDISLLCRICNKPVPIETAKTEENRSWSAIAKELSQEQDARKVGELAKELNKALDQAEADRHPPIQKMQE